MGDSILSSIDEIIGNFDGLISRNIRENSILTNIYKNIDNHNVDNTNIINKDDTYTFVVEDMLIDDIDIRTLKSKCKKNINKSFDDIISNICFEGNQGNIFRFQYLINNLFNKMVTYILEHLNVIIRSKGKQELQDRDIIFLYKGGTTLKILFDKYREILKDTQNDNFFIDFEQYFKRSDSDYVIMINPNINFDTNGISFEFVYYIVCFYTTHVLNIIKNKIYETSDTNAIIDKTKITPELMQEKVFEIDEAITDIKKDVELKDICVQYTNCGNLINIGFINSDNRILNFYPSQSELSDQILQKMIETVNGDIIVMCDTDSNMYIKKINTDRLSDIQFSLNNDVYIRTGENIASFCLQRLKINFVGCFQNISDQPDQPNQSNPICSKFSAELVDVVIFKKDSTALKDFYKNIGKEYNIYSYDLYDKKLQYNSYSIYGHLNDLIYILFDMSYFPWVDNKYKNRINRLIFMIIIELYHSDQQNFVLYFKNFRKMIINCHIILYNFIKTIKMINDINLDNDENIKLSEVILKFNKIDIKKPILQCLDKLNQLIIFYKQKIEDDSVIIKLIDKLYESINKIDKLRDLIKLSDMIKHMTSKLIKFNIGNISENIDVLTREFGSIDLYGSKVYLIGGDKYKNKYLKYKTKYLKLKNNLVDKK
jgi:hypothetical protein